MRPTYSVNISFHTIDLNAIPTSTTDHEINSEEFHSIDPDATPTSTTDDGEISSEEFRSIDPDATPISTTDGDEISSEEVNQILWTINRAQDDVRTHGFASTARFPNDGIDVDRNAIKVVTDEMIDVDRDSVDRDTDELMSEDEDHEAND